MPLTVGAISESMSAEQVVNILTTLVGHQTNHMLGGLIHIITTQEVKQLHKLLQVFGHGYPHQDVL